MPDDGSLLLPSILWAALFVTAGLFAIRHWLTH